MEKKSGKRKANEDMGFQGYGLRDNPKKSWKSVGLNGGGDDYATSSSTLEVQCKVCGKEFESMKALFGHMRHHTAKERKEVNCQECGEKFKSLKALTAHMRLHPLKNTTVKRKRSKRLRYNNSNGLNSSVSSSNGSPGFVDTDRDVEEAALCLMMLSKGVRNWTEFNSEEALGGHQTIHRKGNAWHVEPDLVDDCEKDTHVSSPTEIMASCTRVKVENVEDSMDQEMNEATSLETRVCDKVHRCMVCFKVFRSGQALGGHKRSHISRDPETNDKQLDLSNINVKANGDT